MFSKARPQLHQFERDLQVGIHLLHAATVFICRNIYLCRRGVRGFPTGRKKRDAEMQEELLTETFIFEKKRNVIITSSASQKTVWSRVW